MKAPSPFAVALAFVAVATAILSSTSIDALPESMTFRQVRKCEEIVMFHVLFANAAGCNLQSPHLTSLCPCCSTRTRERFPPVPLKRIKSFTGEWKRLLTVTPFESGAMDVTCYVASVRHSACSTMEAHGSSTHFSLHRHYPFYPLGLKSRYDGRLSDNTISVRIYAVDCPETGTNLSP
jgi:hypothetical protein